MGPEGKTNPEIHERLNLTSEKMLAAREMTPKESLEKEIEAMEMKLRDFRALYRALPDEMGWEASRALRYLISKMNGQ